MTKRVLAFLLVTVSAAPRGAHAKFPDPAHTHVDPVLVTCPAGDVAFTVVERDFMNNPSVFSDTRIELCGCPGVVLDSIPPGSAYERVDSCDVRNFSDNDGISRFFLRAGGVCDRTIWVGADGVQQGTVPAAASFDQDGDLRVTSADLALIAAKRGGSDRTADFDGNGVVDDADLERARTHLGHAAAVVLDVGQRPAAGLQIVARPNPARGPIEFAIQVPERAAASLAVFDLSGRRRATVLHRTLEAGAQTARWSGRDDRGDAVAPGLYFYRFTLGDRSQARLIVIAR